MTKDGYLSLRTILDKQYSTASMSVTEVMLLIAAFRRCIVAYVEKSKRIPPMDPLTMKCLKDMVYFSSQQPCSGPGKSAVGSSKIKVEMPGILNCFFGIIPILDEFTARVFKY